METEPISPLTVSVTSSAVACGGADRAQNRQALRRNAKTSFTKKLLRTGGHAWTLATIGASCSPDSIKASRASLTVRTIASHAARATGPARRSRSASCGTRCAAATCTCACRRRRRATQRGERRRDRAARAHREQAQEQEREEGHEAAAREGLHN